MDIALLGPLRVTLDGGTADVAGARLGRLLTRLAVDAPAAVSVVALVEAVWDGDEPADPANALQSLVSRLRRTLGGPQTVQQTAAGYRLLVERSGVDLHRFHDAVRAAGTASSTDPQRSWELADLALSYWRGSPDHQDAIPALRRHELLRAEARLIRADACLALGRSAEVLDDLLAMHLEDPSREDVVRLLMAAYTAGGRGAEALRLYEELRVRLADELGTDPDQETRALHVSLLRNDVAPAAATAPTTLPAEVSSFVSRQDELDRLADLLEQSRLVTVLGPGGVGKTRLALRAAADAVGGHPDGVWLVELASVTEAAGVGPAVVTGIGVREARIMARSTPDSVPTDPVGRIVAQLGSARSLLVLDNCEHLIEPVAVLVGQLLARCPQLRVLATSREPLAITGESLLVVPPLGLPAAEDPASDVLWSEAVWSAPSVRLFVDRARAVHPAFRAGAETAADVVEIVRRLDGLPLAIELAAARLRTLPLAEIRRRLDDRFRLLTGGSRTALPRHRTLRAVVEWSWDLLTDDERRLAERLAVFPAGATAAAAAAVYGPGGGSEVAGVLDALVDKSLIAVTDGDPVRYRMLETIREFGLDRLTDDGALEAARDDHARYLADLVDATTPVLRTPDQRTALAVIEAEHENIVAAVRFLATGPSPGRALTTAHAMLWFWVITGRHTEAVSLLSAVLAATEGSTDPRRLYLEASLSINQLADELARTHGSWEDVRTRMRSVADRLEAAEPLADPTAVVLRAAIRLFGGPLTDSSPAVADALASDDPWVRGTVRSIRINFLENEGLREPLREDVDRALADFTEVGDRWGLAIVLSARGLLRTGDSDLDGALADYQRAWECVSELSTSDEDLMLLMRLADLHLRRGEVAEGRWAAERARRAGTARSTDAARSMLAASVLLMATWCEHGPAVAYRQLQEIRVEMARLGPAAVLYGHVQAVVGAAAAFVCARAGRPGEALLELGTAYPQAVVTQDRPIIATVGVSVAATALALGRPEIAAEMLGAACRIRGSDDPTDLIVRIVTAEARAVIGADFDVAHARGRQTDPPTAIGWVAPARLEHEAAAG